MTRPASGTTNAVWYLDTAPATVARWIERLHWTRTIVSAALVALALLLPPADFPLRRLAPLLAASALVQLEAALRSCRGRATPLFASVAALAVDIALLTGLLELSGGPSNPFAVVYAVQIVLAGATLGAAWGAGLGAWAGVCLGLLIYWHLDELVPSHHRLIDLPTHLFTMWLALATLAELAGHLLRESTAAISRREAELVAMRAGAARQERLMSLTTLAAGAAHELSTPLATVAVASRELERSLSQAGGRDEWIDDARLIREQVDRCHTILDQMSGRAVGPPADCADPFDLDVLLGELSRRLPADQAARIRLVVAKPAPQIRVPRAGLAQVLLSLVKNAFDASAETTPVTLEAIEQQGVVRLIIRDEGTGMREDVLLRAGEPFYTTKEPGRGMGLGIFLARLFAERCGGTLTLRSDRGTIAVLELPAAPPSPEPA